MKKQILSTTSLLLFSILLLTGCLKDDYRHSYKVFIPVYKTLSEVRSEIKVTDPTSLTGNFKLYITADRIYLSEKDKGVHIIDNSDPSHPKNTAFINIPGHTDAVIRGKMMYADLYCDLAAIEITGSKSISLKKYLTNIFPYRLDRATASVNPDSIQVVVDWIAKDTVVTLDQANAWRNCPNCGPVVFASAAQSSGDAGKSSGGVGGSMARFTDVNNYLYTITPSQINVVNLVNPADPTLLKTKTIGGAMETVFPFKNNLFIGSSNGMYIADITNPVDPQMKSFRGHWRSCDPVIADDNYAYVTLFDAAICGGSLNQLEIYNTSDILSPTLVKTYPLTNPHGLSKDGNYLFICDGKDGLKVFDASAVNNLKQIAHLKGAETYDVIAINGIAYVSAKGGLYQYDYKDINNIHLLSKLDWKD